MPVFMLLCFFSLSTSMVGKQMWTFCVWLGVHDVFIANIHLARRGIYTASCLPTCLSTNIIIILMAPRVNLFPTPELLLIKTPSYSYRDSHYKPETVVRPSQFYNVDSYTRKTASFWWIKALRQLLCDVYKLIIANSLQWRHMSLNTSQTTGICTLNSRVCSG